jgi:hypothetical protein
MKSDFVTIIRIIAAAILVAIAICMFGCKTTQPIVQEKIVEVEKIVTERDTIVTTRPDSASIHALLVCDSLGNVLIRELAEEQGKNVALEMRLFNANNRTQSATPQVVTAIEIDCKADSLQVLVDKYRAELLDKRAEKVTETIEVKYIPSFVKWLAWVGAGAILYVILRFALWIYKKFHLK